jgi:CRISPR-associated protein Cmr1
LAEIRLRLRAIAPIFLNGSDSSGSPEWRAPSVRGQLRYWARAILGAQTGGDLNLVHKQESLVFGSTGQGSPVTIRLSTFSKESQSRAMLPHREYSGGNVSKAPSIPEGSTTTLTCLTKPAVTVPTLFSDALITWLLLGGVGKRSRRMFGSLAIQKTEGSEDLERLRMLQSADEYAQAVNSYLTSLIGTGKNLTGIPAFPMLHPAHSWIIVGREPYENATLANKALFGILRGQYKQEEAYFGGAMRGRRASQLIAQVRQIGDEYFPVLTYLRSKPELHGSNNRADWKVVNSFMKDCLSVFSGTTAWGGEFK